MAKTDNIIEIEIDGPQNENLVFRPLQRTIRGRFDFNRVAEPTARMKLNQWGGAIPGQRLRVDLDKQEATIVDGLHDPQHAATRKTIINSGQYELPPAEEVIPNIHVPTWLHYLKLAVSSGIARVIQGVLPDRVNGIPQTSFYTRPASQSTDRVADAIDNMAKALETNTQLVAAMLKRLESK
jgi:hypothetical protein